ALFIAYSSFTEGISAGCNDWDLHTNNEVCCNHCKPGNHLVRKCGPDVNQLCTPCEDKTYSHSSSAWSCNRCTQCIDPQVELKPCDRVKDTVCGCKKGYRCGNEPQCDFCIEECTMGQEPTAERTCRKCPEGTFNDKIHSECKPWRK
ncbi:tumor necrosis factor receptor superfamily member 9 precursor, partial [Silurus meridionalis]